MGSGRWDASVYHSVSSASLRDHGTSFLYNKTAHATGRLEVSPTLDPKIVAGDLSPFAGQVMREARDSDEHPESLPIAVLFDVTGSMHSIPVTLQAKLPKLYGLLLARGYVEHPQILFGAVGDATCDRVPLQIGQFESDNRADANLADLFLEGGGGGQTMESYELAAYFMARHTATDAWEKRGKRGYLFLIGDEHAYSRIDPQQVRQQIGDDLAEPLSTPSVFAELAERWDTYFLFAEQGSYSFGEIIDVAPANGVPWRALLGQNVLRLEDADAVCETIALTVGLGEGTVDLEEGLEHLREEGTDDRAIEATSKALATVGAGTKGALGEADTDVEVSGDEGAERI